MNTTVKTFSYKDIIDIPYANKILSTEACEFLLELHNEFDGRRKELLNHRVLKQKEYDQGQLPDFDPSTQKIRESEWVAAPIPSFLQDRRVEITGPVDRKMIINALNSGANCFMADFEDSNSPTWENILNGQINLRDAVNKTITFRHPAKEKVYQLNPKTATLMVRPRGLHLSEEHFCVENECISGSLFDFGLYFFHNVHQLLENGVAPVFYLPKLEYYQEANWWNDVFVFAQKYFDIPVGTIKATVLVETITATFQLNEIIYSLKDHIAGLNCGRWDYIFSYIKKLKNTLDFIVPDRDQVTMITPFMEAYSLQVIEVCHKRKIHAMGGMAAQIPINNDSEDNEIALDKVRKDKLREVTNGHDGTWVAHPALVQVAKEIFDQYMPDANQINRKLNQKTTQKQLLDVPKGNITEKGIRKNINVAILYIESWLQGVGAAAIYHLMEDAATAEISRTQLWQWLQHEVKIETGEHFNVEMYTILQKDELNKIKSYVGEEYYRNGRFAEAVEILDELVLEKNFTEFLTLKAYKYIK